MTRVVVLVRRFPLVAVTIAIGVVAGVLVATGLEPAARWVISLYALTIAAVEAVRMIRGLLSKQFGLDILAVTAIVSTIVVGEYWASLLIVLMLTGGEALEVAAVGRAQRELRSLLDRVPQLAHRIEANGDVVEVPAHEVRVGDRLLVRPAEIVPVDAELASALGGFDESSLTGESLPVDKVAGDAVLSGSVNGPVAVEVVATALAADSQYQRIVELVREAASSKAPLVRLADRYALPFTAVSLGIAGLAWALSGDPVRFAEVLVVATPCPLLIAAPVAFMGGMSSAAKRGIVMKNAGSLEKLARARTVAFDKTGTLTVGRPEVVGAHAEAGFTESELVQLVGSAERYSSHVLAESLQRAAGDRGLPLLESRDAREVPAHGVIATITGRVVVVGKPAFVAEHAPDVVAHPGASGEAVIYAAIDGRFAGVVVLRDAVRTDAADTLAALRALGVTRTLMVTGDIAATAEPIAAGLGITDVNAECLPDDKVRIIRELQPRPVVMVGDGVNDAPVLAVADVGIAMGAKGSTAASESADVVILIDDLARVARAIAIGQRTVRIALQSIWLGIAISIALMLVAAVGLLPAIAGAALQEVVDLIAIVGALRAVRAGAAPVPGLDAPLAGPRTRTGPVPVAVGVTGTGPVTGDG
ncbi:heavy metal translocating P-type ATPase [Microcella sp.]|uniref:heavy metal translocating P-type ATPase n=1 Tax=Microcella sp. TaxID=1913979 RepID=UPI00299F850C|nr:heavy metal translocating P-type ATPase [Microcella sp.]MDX2026857.1 heavy metal translocating P-type ATPase [Microcella sp.]